MTRLERAPSRSASWLLLPAVAVISAGVAVAGFPDSAILIALLLVLLVVPILTAALKGQFDPFEPSVTFAAMMFLLLVLHPAAVVVSNNFLWRGFDTRPGLVPMLWISCVGVAAWSVGYEFARLVQPAARPTALSKPAPELWAAASCLTAFVAVAATLAFIQTAHLPISWLWTGRGASDAVYRNSVSYLYESSLLGIPASLMAVSAYSQGIRWHLPAVMALLTPLLLADFAKGDRLFLLSWGLSVTTYGYLLAGRRPRLLALISALPIALLISAFLGTARVASPGLNPVTVFAQTLSNPGGVARQLALGADTEAGQGLMFMTTQIPGTYPFQPGALTASILLAPVPTAIWHSKPRIPEEQFTARAFPADYLNSRAGATYTAMGSLYFDGGPLEVAMGMLLAGIVVRLGWAGLASSRDSTRLAIAALMPAVMVAFARASVPPAALILFWGVPPLLCIAMASRRLGRGHF